MLSSDKKSSALRARWAAGAAAWVVGGSALLAPAATPADQPDIRRDATVAAIEMVMPCVVNIATETIHESHDWYDVARSKYCGVPLPQSKSISLGSGVIIDEEGYLLTNFHVVNGANRIQVKLWDGREYEAEPLVATGGSDVALLRIKGHPGDHFRAIRFAPDDDLLLGETVLALGNPFGLGGSVTRGILSSKNRRPRPEDAALKIEDWLETDAAINPGNSGGPLVNLRGELIGLNVAVSQQREGMGLGFSIPIKQVSAALAHFFRPEFADGLWCGAQLKGGSGPLSVAAVYPGSPAAKAGLRDGDQISQVNGQPPVGVISFNRCLFKDSQQDNRLVVTRGGQKSTLTLRLLPLTDLFRQRLGMTLSEPGRAGTPGTLVVDEVDRDGPAGRAGLRKGMVVASLDGAVIRDLRTTADRLVERQREDVVRLGVLSHRQLATGYVETRQMSIELKVR